MFDSHYLTFIRMKFSFYYLVTKSKEYLYPFVVVQYPLRFLSTAKFSCHQHTVICVYQYLFLRVNHS